MLDNLVYLIGDPSIFLILFLLVWEGVGGGWEGVGRGLNNRKIFIYSEILRILYYLLPDGRGWRGLNRSLIKK